MYARIVTASLYGLISREVCVEVAVENGFPSFCVVGLANQSIKEAKERIHSAVLNCGYTFPCKRVTVNLSPANQRKSGSHFDLPIALGLLISTNQAVVSKDVVNGTAFLGELTLDGRLEPVEGVLPLVIGMQKRGITDVVLPMSNIKEAMLVKGMNLYAAPTLLQAVEHATGFRPIKPILADGVCGFDFEEELPDFLDIRGQESVKRAALVAASGAHGLLMIGPPGVGKTMIGKRMPGIMPPLSYEEQLDVTQIYSVAGELSQSRPMIQRRPFRSPHHSMSATAMIGGGSFPRPGEVSLAHSGVLFLDELPEFNTHVLQTLRQPMEEGSVTIARVNETSTFPARFILVAAMNPCRCGYYGDPVKVCTCTESDRQRYVGKVSGPLLDRIDLHIAMEQIFYKDVATQNSEEKGKTTSAMRAEVSAAYELQKNRYAKLSIDYNSQMTPRQIKKYCVLDDRCSKLLEEAFSVWRLSARSYHKILKVARTIADLSGCSSIKEEHILEALSYRMPDRLIK
ncbi:MAG: ATP-binding protein [Clostridia bacterium]|nr:ATP-binding protein [Clostridia bacterium]